MQSAPHTSMALSISRYSSGKPWHSELAQHWPSGPDTEKEGVGETRRGAAFTRMLYTRGVKPLYTCA